MLVFAILTIKKTSGYLSFNQNERKFSIMVFPKNKKQLFVKIISIFLILI